MKAGELRKKLRDLGQDRDKHDASAVALEARTFELLSEASSHPEVSITEAARLAGIKRRATAYAYLERGKHG